VSGFENDIQDHHEHKDKAQGQRHLGQNSEAFSEGGGSRIRKGEIQNQVRDEYERGENQCAIVASSSPWCVSLDLLQ